MALLIVQGTNGFAQELEPRSLTNLPVGTNFAILGYGFAAGNILFDPALPLEDVQAKTHTLVGAYVRSIDFFGLAAKANVILPAATGYWEGVYQGVDSSTARSGVGDLRFGFSFNFAGSPALRGEAFKAFEQTSIAGFSLQILTPTGQYFNDKLINLGSNRWAFRPQLGASHKIKTWYVEYAANIWVYTANNDFWFGNRLQQKPVGTVKLHLIKSFNKGIWAAFGAGYAFGGKSYINGEKRNSNLSVMRLGAIFTLPIRVRHSLKVSAMTAIRFKEGADYDSLGLTYQYMWN